MSRKTNAPPPYGGIINLRKPVGPTSLMLVNRVKRLSGIRRIGHCGTLDPFADGVLPIALGRATNMIRYMDDYSKVYRVLIHLGTRTDTGDLSGRIVESSDPTDQQIADWARDDYQALRAAIARMTGRIEQRTPQFSAAKIDGKPMYEYARAGIEVTGKMRAIQIHSADLVTAGELKPSSESLNESNLPGQDYFPETIYDDRRLDEPVQLHMPRFCLIVDVHCSKGTYIRTWAEDLGYALGTTAYAARLRRLRSGPFTWADAVSEADLKAFHTAGGDFGRPDEKLICDTSAARPDLPVIELDRQEAIRILQGKRLVPPPGTESHYRLFHGDQFLGIGRRDRRDSECVLLAERMFLSIENFTD